jgi:hypothetical protein
VCFSTKKSFNLQNTLVNAIVGLVPRVLYTVVGIEDEVENLRMLKNTLGGNLLKRWHCNPRS